ncbi:MAG: ImmA/IrrE family metallo-endopeptidase [Armatimonadota bacterium]
MGTESGFLSVDQIRSYAEETLRLYGERLGREPVFPLDAEDLARRVWGLDVYYDGEGYLDGKAGTAVLAVLFPDRFFCPLTGTDRVIVINDAPRFRRVTTGFSILHEVGHYHLQWTRGHWPPRQERSLIYCRSDDVTGKTRSRIPQIEWQANRYAGEVYMPAREIPRLLDGKQPEAGEIIVMDIYKPILRQFFGASEAMVEKRLKDLGYKLLGARYPWAQASFS